MPSKKRKYEARFPPARIKKIMQTDEEIGKVAAAVPVIISRSLEIFLQSLVETTACYTNERKAKTMTTSHLKHCIEGEKKFDFLKYLVADIADIANQEEEEAGENGEKPKKQRKPRVTAAERKKKKARHSSSDDDTDSTSEIEDKPTNIDTPLMASALVGNPQPTSHSINSIITAGGSSSSSLSKPPSDEASYPPPLGYIHGNMEQSVEPSLPQQPSTIQQPAAMPMNVPASFQQHSSVFQQACSMIDEEDDDYDT